MSEFRKIFRTPLAYAVYDEFPVSQGHVLVIPNRHVQSFFDLNENEVEQMFLIATKVKKMLDVLFHPDGYNIGFNVNEAAGQSVNHVHMHIIPRYKGDVENPRGGVRGVIPSKQNY